MLGLEYDTKLDYYEFKSENDLEKPPGQVELEAYHLITMADSQILQGYCKDFTKIVTPGLNLQTEIIS